MGKTKDKKAANRDTTRYEMTIDILREGAPFREEWYLNNDRDADTKVKAICGRHVEALQKHILERPANRISNKLLNKMYAAFCADIAAVGGVMLSNDLAEKTTSFNAPFGSDKCIALLIDTHAIRVQLEKLEVYLYAMNTNGFYKSLQKTVAEFVSSAETLQKSIDFFEDKNE